jgi:hypothetical protein
MSDRKWEFVTAVHDMLEAEILKGLLEANGVMIHIVREGYQAAYGITNQPSVRIELLAPNDQIDIARQIISDYEAGFFDTDG